MQPARYLALVPAQHLISVSACEFGAHQVLSRAEPIDLPALTSGKRLENPQMSDGTALFSLPAVSFTDGTPQLLWADSDSQPRVQDLLEAAGFWQEFSRYFPATPQTLFLSDGQKIDLDAALTLWNSLRQTWRNITPARPAPSWFADDGLRRCGTCPVCRQAMQDERDVGVLPSVGAKNRRALQEELKIRTISELARIQASVPEEWLTAVGEAALREGIDRPEADLLTLNQQSWDEERSARELEFLMQERRHQLLEEETELFDAEPPSPAEEALNTYVENLPAGELSASDQAIAMIASATGYHRRERTEFWTENFARVYAPLDEWVLGRGVGRVLDATPVAGWEKDPDKPRAQPARVIDLKLQVGENFSLKKGDKGLCLYYGENRPAHLIPKAADAALDFEERQQKLPRTVNVPDFRAEVLEVQAAGKALWVKLKESLPRGAEEFHQLPLGLGPAQPIPTKSQEAALLALAEATGDSLPELPVCAAADLAARRPPRLTGGGLAPVLDGTSAKSPLALALIDSLTRLNNSYLAVQGPPGAGKTFVGSLVLSALLAQGWKIGVVAQSHAVVENMLAACLESEQVSTERVAKFKGKTQMKNAPWGEVSEKELPDFLADDEGFLIGGTAWDFSSTKKFAPQSLDLLVIDEAGQYSLANTFAVAQAARNLLLLGDPQQLPQVTQGEHPHHVEESALGWLIGDSPVLPERFGYFMDLTWRMHPALCAPVSQLSYQGALKSAPAASTRRLDAWEPGVYVHPVAHDFNTTASTEEAGAVIHAVERFIGSTWQDSAVQRPLTGQDILVVAAYNAQVEAISSALEQAGFTGKQAVKVGTVDKFQGQQAPVVIVSMAASTPAVSEQTADFLLSANRLNVAISRGQWAAVLVMSPQFLRYVPRSFAELEKLSSVTRLVQDAMPFS